MIDRELHRIRIEGLLTRFPVVAILRARQIGKTMLANEIASVAVLRSIRFDLESPPRPSLGCTAEVL